MNVYYFPDFENVLKEIYLMRSNEKLKLIEGIEGVKFDRADCYNFSFYKNKKGAFVVDSFNLDLIGGFVQRCLNDRKVPSVVLFCSTISLDRMKAILELGLKRENLLIVGARNFSLEELEFFNLEKIKLIGLSTLLNNLDEITETIMEFCYGKELFLGLSGGVVDPAFISAKNQEVYGMSVRECISIVSRIGRMKNLDSLELYDFEKSKKEERVMAKIV